MIVVSPLPFHLNFINRSTFLNLFTLMIKRITLFFSLPDPYLYFIFIFPPYWFIFLHSLVELIFLCNMLKLLEHKCVISLLIFHVPHSFQLALLLAHTFTLFKQALFLKIITKTFRQKKTRLKFRYSATCSNFSTTSIISNCQKPLKIWISKQR